MLAGPVWVYLVGFVLALPTYILVAALAVMLVRLLLQWMFADGSAPAVTAAGEAQGKETLKG